MNSNALRPILATAALAMGLSVLPTAGLAQTSGSVSWNGWTFSYEVSGNYDGLSLKDVRFRDIPLIHKIALPVVRVFYDGNACGPFADRLGGTLSPIPWAGNATVARREFTLDGRQWYEIGIRDQIGDYDMYQVYYLSADGILDAHFYSKGMQCWVDHVHYPNWRIDFDVDGNTNDQIQSKTASGFAGRAIEFNANATDALDHGWRVRDSITGNFVDVLPGFSGFTIPNEPNEPVSGYANHTVFGRLFKDAEDTGWTYGPNTQVPYNNGETIDNSDLVFWYEAYMPHSAAEGSSLWHSTGIRLAVNGGFSPAPPPPPPPSTGNGLTQTFVNGSAIAIPDSGKGSPYPSTVDVQGMAGVISKVTVTLEGFGHTYPDDVDVLLVGPGGQSVLLMSDAGGSADATNLTLSFDNTAAASLPDSGQISSGTYRPTNYGASDSFSAPAPSRPFGSSLGVFNQTAPNGSWKLFVTDDYRNDLGSIARGWKLTITTN